MEASGSPEDVLRAAGAQEERFASAPGGSEGTRSAEWWLTRQLDKPEPLMGEVIVSTTRLMMGGETGIGKTHLAMGMAAALATGQPFAHWRVHRKVRVLYVDGEMARDLMQERIADLKRRLGNADLSLLSIVCREDYPDMQPLNTDAGRTFILGLVAAWKVEVVFFDNRMSLLSGDMKDEVPWTDTMELVRALTRARVAQCWIDHTGHDKGKIYGSKTKEWQLDTVALISKVERADTDVAFQIEFSKARRRRPDTREDFASVTLALRDDRWDVETMAAKPRKTRLPPQTTQFYAAFQDALCRSATPGSATRGEWYGECVRVGLAEAFSGDADWRERSSKQSLFRKCLGQIKAAGLIGVNGEKVTDLRQVAP